MHPSPPPHPRQCFIYRVLRLKYITFLFGTINHGVLWPYSGLHVFLSVDYKFSSNVYFLESLQCKTVQKNSV